MVREPTLLPALDLTGTFVFALAVAIAAGIAVAASGAHVYGLPAALGGHGLLRHQDAGGSATT